MAKNSDGNIDISAKDVEYLIKDTKAFYKNDESFLYKNDET